MAGLTGLFYWGAGALVFSELASDQVALAIGLVGGVGMFLLIFWAVSDPL